MMKTNFFGKALAIAMMLLGLTFVSCDEFDNPLPADWDGVSPNLPLTLEAVNDGATMNVTFTSTLPETTTIEYSTDGGKSWHFFTISGGKPAYIYGDPTTPTPQPEISYSRTISGVHQILIKAENESYGSSEKGDLAADYIRGDIRHLNIKVDADCYIYGNVMSMIGGDKFASKTDLSGKYNFFRMFQGNPKLKSHPTKNLLLPATNVTDSCYYAMYGSCSALTVAPELPATKMAKGCYQEMFLNCSALTTAPALPATTLAEFCYSWMFSNCSALKNAPELPAKTMKESCYQDMFENCPSLETAPALPAEELADNCYYGMFCNSLGTPGYKLKNAPALPAKTLKKGCYGWMFTNCYALETAPELPAETLEESCYYSMFSYCTALVKAPVLPAKELKQFCYWDMFNGCTSLNYIKCLATSIATGAGAPTATWVFGVPAGGTFVVADKTKYGAGLFWDPTSFGWDFSGTTCMAPAGWIAKNPDEE